MQVDWPLKQKIDLASALLALAFFQGVSCFPAYALQETGTPKRFADWCVNKANLPLDTRRTVDALLQKAGTQECDRAEKQLATLTKLDLSSSQIADVRPLSSLSNLIELDLSLNQMQI
jgi:internalin A